MNRQRWKLVALVVLVIAGISAVQHFGIRNFTPDRIQHFILSFGWWAPLLYIALYTVRPLFFFPAVLLTLTGGLTFGPGWGTFYDTIGASLGAYLAFGISRYLGRETVEKLLGNRLQQMDLYSKKYGFRTIVFLRLIPLIPFDVINYGAGLTKIRFRDYAIATTLGIIPGAFAYNFLGSSLHHLFSPSFFLAVGLVVLLSVVPLWVKRKKKLSSVDKPDESKKE